MSDPRTEVALHHIAAMRATLREAQPVHIPPRAGPPPQVRSQAEAEADTMAEAADLHEATG